MESQEASQIYDWRELCKVIAWYRRSFNLTQHEFAKRISTHYSTVSRWESGKSQPRAEELVKTARLFGISEQDLLYPSDEVKKWVNMSLKVT